MRNISKKRLAVIAGGTAAVMAGAGIGYAYWTSTGSGTGTASTKTPADSQLEVSSYTAPSDMAPGIDPGAITVTVDNKDNSNTYAGQVVVSIDSVTKATGAPAGTCDATDYVLANPTMTTGAQDLAPNGQTGDSTTFSGATLGFNNKGTSQDACKGATVNLAFALS